MGEITNEFVIAFRESFNKFFPDCGRDEIEFAIAKFLNPFTISGLSFDEKMANFRSTVKRICDVLQPMADQQEEESQSSIDVGGTSQVLE